MPYVYLIQPADLLNTNQFKVGMSSLDNLSRARSYKNGSRYLFICECSDALEVERKIIKKFNQNYTLVRGREYFEVDNETEMRDRFINIVLKHKSQTHKSIPIAETWMQKFAFKAS